MKNRYKPMTDWRFLIPGAQLATVWILLIVLAIFVSDSSSTNASYRFLQEEEEQQEETEEEYQARVDAFLADQRERYIWDEEHGPLHYHPYAGGTLFPEIETLTKKPGFKIWVDGGVLDYEESTCVEKQLDCS